MHSRDLQSPYGLLLKKNNQIKQPSLPTETGLKEWPRRGQAKQNKQASHPSL